MTTVRCYVPLDAEQLERLRVDRRLEGPLPACTVTASIRASNPTGDPEEWEYVALLAAAKDQLDRSAPVLVAAVDLTEDQVDSRRPDGPRVQVGTVDLPRIAAFHLGDDVVTGDPGAVSGTGPDDDAELSWYDTTELSHVLELARALDRPSN